MEFFFIYIKKTNTLESSFVGMLNSLTPIFTLFLGIYFFKTKPSILNIIGIIIGFLGAVLLYFSEISNLYTINISVLFSCFCLFVFMDLCECYPKIFREMRSY